MVRFLFQFILVFFLVGTLYSQERFPDSVKTNEEKVIYYNYIALNNQDTDSTYFYYNKAIEYVGEKKCDSISLSAYLGKTGVLYNLGRYDDFLQAITSLEKITTACKSPYFVYRTYMFYADYYSLVENQDKAIEYNKKAIEVAKNLNDLALADTYFSLGYTYYLTGFNKQAKKHYLTALKYYKNAQVNERFLTKTYSALANVSESLNEANIYLKKVLTIYETTKITNPAVLAYYYMQKGDIYLKFNAPYQITKATIEKGIAYNDSIKNPQLKYFNLVNLAKLESKEKNYSKSNEIFNTVLQGNFNTGLYNKSAIYQGLIENYSELKDYKNALLISNKLFKLQDSISKNYSSEKFAEFDAKFKTAEKDKEIAQQKLQLEQEKSKRNKLIFGSLGLLLLGFMGFQWNNNRQKRKKLLAETQLQKEQEVNELRTKFLGNIAHEIRTPLTLISGNLNLALENINQKEKAKQNIKTALINSKKVVEDANEILELLKFEKNKTTIKLNTVPLDQTLKRIFKSFASLAEMKQIKLVYQSNIEANVTAKIDVEKVEKILNNLVSNAVKYSPSDSKIIFDAQLDNTQQLTVKVTDFGQGIHFNETEKIFERFYQSSQSNAVGGIGIGLSLAKEFSELLNGSLTVESELGKGSTFIFTMPVETSVIESVSEEKVTPTIQKDVKQSEKSLSNTSTSKEESSTDNNEITSSSKPKILIVEDNPEMASYLEEILSEKYDCEKAFDGQQALDKMNANSYDLITSDIMMPRLDGFQLREKLNENPKLKNIPFILISAKTLEEDIIKGFNLGIDDYVVKPFNKNELLARINNLLQNKFDRESWIQQHPEDVEEIDAAQKQLLDKIKAVVEENISDEEFKVTQLASVVGYSQRQLTRILKQHTGMSPVKFILEIRLQKAYWLLQNKVHFTLSEVRYDVGIPSSSYFNRKFKKRFGINPSELLT